MIKQLPYEEVIFVDIINEPDRLDKSFESVFVNVEQDQNSQSNSIKNNNETDPLLVEKKISTQESASILEEKISSNLFKVSAKNILPKVVDWSSGSIESISNEIPHKKRAKYPPVLICEFCGKQFDGKDRVYKFFYHRNQSHTQEIKYTCPVCQKLYWGERELSAHVVSHLGKEFICEFCGVTFQRKNDLLRHQL
ncbi:UNVERIFIED_CONTAM: hypothetical protein GTU68_012973, partial [Idotea baltica]|nr:hypothetical protein [Idotea baltica]